jgi:phytoene synthase
MNADTFVTRYETYSELEIYMEGSASVVGYMMSSIIGYRGDAMNYAQALGQAMQLTNFLRDVQEDFEKSRIYIPKEWLDKFGVSEDYFKNKIVDDKWVGLMRYAISFNNELYEKAYYGIRFLDRSGQRQVYAALLLYKEILKEIEKQNYDVFRKRAHVSTSKKVLLIAKAFCYTKKYE